ncbi:uncharacterized protein UTRI_06704_B [Ustilago trichophora]|uniref:Serine hydrolase domain-containing protein n=1 Tax=Ustilago trichophora TaxID=86804 RepID=A0A5C3ER99_9BASI|nr:uncharacterized protein UTRI_06704_B [Ustilago trichophora]
MPTRKLKLLALHGKGTSARIMKAQIKPIIDMLSDILEVHYLDGGAVSAPYQGIEIMFPTESYHAWYEQPTSVELHAAHSRVAQHLAVPTDLIRKQPRKDPVVITTSPERNDLGVFTPPETPTSSTPAFTTANLPLHRSPSLQSQHSRSFEPTITENGREALLRRFTHLVTGLDTPESYPSTAGPRTPLYAEHGLYDGLICFSQGCAVSTGLLLELGDKYGCGGLLPVRFVVLICGGRPFDRDGTMERVDSTSVVPIKLPSLHIHGRQDPGLDESRRLAALYCDANKQIIELDIGHCPPRRTSDVNLVAAAIRRMMLDLS